MSFIGHAVNKLEREPISPGSVTRPALALALILALVLVLSPALGAAQAAEPFVVAPVKKAEDLRLLPATAWPPPESDSAEMLIKLTYLRGLLDALQYVEVAPKSAAKTLQDLSGMSLTDLAAALDSYYLTDPRRRELPPAAVFFRMLAAQRGQKEITPLPAPEPRP
jgi:hypothetical protein